MIYNLASGYSSIGMGRGFGVLKDTILEWQMDRSVRMVLSVRSHLPFRTKICKTNICKHSNKNEPLLRYEICTFGNKTQAKSIIHSQQPLFDLNPYK